MRAGCATFWVHHTLFAAQLSQVLRYEKFGSRLKKLERAAARAADTSTAENGMFAELSKRLQKMPSAGTIPPCPPLAVDVAVQTVGTRMPTGLPGSALTCCTLCFAPHPVGLPTPLPVAGVEQVFFSA